MVLGSFLHLPHIGNNTVLFSLSESPDAIKTAKSRVFPQDSAFSRVTQVNEKQSSLEDTARCSSSCLFHCHSTSILLETGRHRKHWVWKDNYSSKQDTFAISGHLKHGNFQQDGKHTLCAVMLSLLWSSSYCIGAIEMIFPLVFFLYYGWHFNALLPLVDRSTHSNNPS